MIPYVFLALFTLVCWYLLKREHIHKITFLIAVFTPAFLMLALRGSGVGEDTAMYLHMAEKAELMTWRSLVPFGNPIIWNPDVSGSGPSVDPGYLLLLKSVMVLTGSPQFALAFCAALTCFCFALFIFNNSDDVAQSYWAFLCGGLFMFAFNGVRQLLAIGIAINFYQLARKGHYFQALLLILLGSSLHRSALAVLLLMAADYLLKYEKAYPAVLIVPLLTPVLVNAAYPLVCMISAQFASYYKMNYWSSSVGGITLIWALMLMCAYVLYKKESSREAELLSFCNVSYVSLAVTALRMSIFERVALYLLPFVCLSFERAVKMIPGKAGILFSLLINGLLLALFISYAASPARTYALFFM